LRHLFVDLIFIDVKKNENLVANFLQISKSNIILIITKNIQFKGIKYIYKLIKAHQNFSKSFVIFFFLIKSSSYKVKFIRLLLILKYFKIDKMQKFYTYFTFF